MRRLELVERGGLEWRDAPALDGPGPGEARVRPVAVATCDLDAAMVRGITPFQPPFPFGHECVAEVEEVGDGVAGVAAGDRVSVPFQVFCGACARCRAGSTAHCDSVPRMSLYGIGDGARRFGGFLADAVLVPYADAMLSPVPAGVAPEAAASVSDNVSDAWRTVGGPLAEHPGAPVLVCGGSGSIDLYVVAIALALEAERVDYVGTRPELRERAAGLGAQIAGDAFPERLGPYPVTVDASADPAGLHCALRSTDVDGICTSTGIYFEPETSVPLLEMYTKGISFHTGMANVGPVIPQVLALIADGRLHPERVTSRVLAFDDAAEAIGGQREKLVFTR